MKILSHASAKKKTKRLKDFKFRIFVVVVVVVVVVFKRHHGSEEVNMYNYLSLFDTTYKGKDPLQKSRTTT